LPLRASLSIDLDNEWSYLKTHGDSAWDTYPTYLDTVIPRFIDLVGKHRIRTTAFVVGQDAALEKNGEAFGMLAAAGHEIGNHSFRHEPWLPKYSRPELDTELRSAHDAIAGATGAEPIGFRAPGYAVSEEVLDALVALGYRYDASSLPTFIGPLARAFYFRGTDLPPDEREREALFGRFSDGFKTLRIHRVRPGARPLDEIPVTTFPGLRVPIHFSYVLYLASYSPPLARAYFQWAMAICRIAGVGPSLLLHPLDLLDGEDAPRLRFFPAMGIPREKKLELLDFSLTTFRSLFEVGTVDEHRAAVIGA
jgi:hypothetical protein